MAANRNLLQTALHKPYDRILFAKEVLSPVFQSGLELSALPVPASVQPNKSEQAVINHIVIYGTITLDDSSKVICYEITLQPNVRIEQSKVAIQRYVRKLLVAGQVALVNFIAPQNKNVWRLTLVAKDSELTDEGVKEKTTHPKRYTYLLGPSETCKTAAERFETLSVEKQINFQTLVNAFSVEKLSKVFFNEYTLHYQKFCNYLQESNFRKSVFSISIPTKATQEEKDKLCKPIRDFVKKHLGRIVFLYFVQKKGWLGASNTDYKDGLTDFIKKLFTQSGGNDSFYPSWLSVLFFDTLNRERANDDFKMPDGKKVKVPFLNGGLFDKEEYDEAVLTIPAKLFHNADFEDTMLTEKNGSSARGFLDFLDSFNFTVHEDSPDDHTVAVDPEMLGHIFENLLEDNKDKGAFYTPKEIVHYMCQESLTEYLTTQLNISDEKLKTDVAYLVKQKEISDATKPLLSKIDEKLDTVKICDPAIGSGAFPMGLLQEIQGIKEVIAFESEQPWKPAEVKENIIQNSIYGVDIEKGAVDIARLRFWLSLVVDEEKPRALPNLDYKIVVGDSLVSKFEGEIIEIDWDKKSSVGKADSYVKNVQQLLKDIAAKQKQFFKPDNKNKKKLHAEIRDLKLELLINQLSYNKAAYENKTPVLGGFAPTTKEIKHNSEREFIVKGFDKNISKLRRLKENKEESFEHFDWKLDFPEVLNPLLKENGGLNATIGFDIVIGNPPYVKVQSIPKDLTILFKNRFVSSTGKYDLYVLFIENSFTLLKKGGCITFINPHRFLISEYGEGLRKFLRERKAIKKVVYFGTEQIFDTATTYTGIFLFKELSDKLSFAIPKSKNLSSLIYFDKIYNSVFNFNFSLDDDSNPIIDKIHQHKRVLEIFGGVYQGIIPMGDDIQVLKGEIKGNIFYGYSNALGKEIEIEKGIVRPLLKGENIQRYTECKSDIYIFYPHFVDKKGKTKPYTEQQLKSTYPLGYSYISNFKKELKHKKEKYKTNPDYWFSLHRSREQYIFENEKIITPQLQNKPSFTLDNGNFYTDAGGYIIMNRKGQRLILKSYLGIFNSKLFYYYIKKTSTPYNNNYYYFKTNYIEPFGIPNLPNDLNQKFSQIVESIIQAKKRNMDTSEMENEMDIKVYHLYNLSFEEAKLIDETITEKEFQKFK